MSAVKVVQLRASSHEDVDPISSLSASEFGPEPLFRKQAINEVDSWRWRKSPTVVAKFEGRFAGYARCKPNEVQDPPHPRIEGQVAVLVQVAVQPEVRGQGVGTALVNREVKTLRMLGFAKVVAQFQRSLAGWYESLCWTVLPINHGHVWIEPHIQRDDGWYPSLPAGKFSPDLRMAHLDAYPQQGFLELGNGQPIVSAEYYAGPHGQFELVNSERARGEALGSDDAALSRVLIALREALVASPSASLALLRAVQCLDP